MDNCQPEITESDLATLRQREPQALERWFRQHADAVYTFLFYRVGRNGELATDLVQETFLAALARLDGFDPARGAMRPWLLFQARNCLRPWLRKRRRLLPGSTRLLELDDHLQEAYSELANTPIPQEVLEREETESLVRLTLSSLPTAYRDCLLRHHAQGESILSIAQAQGLSPGAAKGLLHRARQAFRLAFERFAAAMPGTLKTERKQP